MKLDCSLYRESDSILIIRLFFIVEWIISYKFFKKGGLKNMLEFISNLPNIYFMIILIIGITYCNVSLILLAFKYNGRFSCVWCSCVILYDCYSLFDYFDIYPFWCLFLLLFSYVAICISLKHSIKKLSYVFIFLIVSIFFIFLLTFYFLSY